MNWRTFQSIYISLYHINQYIKLYIIYIIIKKLSSNDFKQM